MKHSFLTMVLLCWLAAVASAQHVWKVNNQGSPSADFTDLPAAVAAASPGDEIWVYYDLNLPSTLAKYTAPLITKPLRIQGFFADLPGTGQSGSNAANLWGPLVVMNIPAGQRVEVSGFSVSSWPVLDPVSIVVLDCAGDVLLENVGLDYNTISRTYVHVERCNDVVFRGCDFELAGSPMMVIDSNALLNTTAIHYYGPGPFVCYPTTTESVRVVNSTVTTIGSVIWGADDYGIGYFYQPGIVVESGTLRVGPANYIHGGQGSSWHAYGVELIDPTVGQVLHDPRGIIVSPSSAFTPAVIDAIYHSWAVANESFDVTVAGPANGYALLCFGDWQPNLPSPLGPLAIDPAAMLPLSLVYLPGPGGFYNWTLNCPLTAPIAHAYAFQALTIAPNGTLGVTVPSPLTVSWPHGVSP